MIKVCISRRFNYTKYSRVSATGVAASVAIPQPSGVQVGGNSALDPDELLLTAPSTNTDVVRIELQGTAVAASKPLSPGQSEIFSGTGKSTLSVIADSGTQNLDITAFYA